MIRRLGSKWKQPIGYFLSSGSIRAKMLQSLTRSCISKVTETGPNVVALVCDQGSNNRSFIQHLEKVSQTNQDCVENLFSIICGFGGHRDNPDVEQFKSSFKYFVADKLFVQSDASNCKVDNAKILLDVSNITMTKYVWTVQTSVDKPTGVDIAVIAPPPLSNATQNVAVYMAVTIHDNTLKSQMLK